MPSLLPHSSQIRSDSNSYLEELQRLVTKSGTKHVGSQHFVAIYKITLAADAIFSKLSRSLKPSPTACRSLIQKIPVLIAISQPGTAQLELRRLIECAFWTIYFSDHPVEWQEFVDKPGKGYARDQASPISYNARREPIFYRNYAKERYLREPSGLIGPSINELEKSYSELSASLHGAAKSTTPRLHPAFEQIEDKDLDRFAKQYKKIAANVLMMLCAFAPGKFNNLPPVHRAWFNWLVGPPTSKAIRGSKFGLD